MRYGILCKVRKKIWIRRAIDGVTRQPLGWQIGHRGDNILRKLFAKLKTQTCTFVTDEWSGFFRLLPARIPEKMNKESVDYEQVS